MTLLTPEETTALKSMSRYRNEVRGRENQTVLIHEVADVVNKLGVRILDIVEFYIANQPKDETPANEDNT